MDTLPRSQMDTFTKKSNLTQYSTILTQYIVLDNFNLMLDVYKSIFDTWQKETLSIKYPQRMFSLKSKKNIYQDTPLI